ncbi:unnamed protein product [Nezara viridula]|uniref:Uncharacterized protein n=1 Tax=Nezara viridula TaxID=85310 RepID=A0A9P0MP88_NEZVI|nr:unnamed protein product [Nezara viridula]
MPEPLGIQGPLLRVAVTNSGTWTGAVPVPHVPLPTENYMREDLIARKMVNTIQREKRFHNGTLNQLPATLGIPTVNVSSFRHTSHTTILNIHQAVTILGT